MTRSRRWSALFACLVGSAALAGEAGCGGGGTGTTSTSTATSSSSTGTGGTGGEASTSTSTGTSTSTSSGTGGSMGGPFTSKGASSYETQTSLAADAKGDVVVAWIDLFADGSSAIGYTVSHDGGGKWTAPAAIKSPGGRQASNPVVTIDGQGRAFVAWLGFEFMGGVTNAHVYLSKLDAVTDTFGAPAIASDDGTSSSRDFDKPSLTVDANDNLLLTWADFTDAQNPALTFARSTDGATFTRSTIVADASFGNLAYLCLDASAGPSAPLYVVHLGAGGTATLRVSTDQGKTWMLGGMPLAKSVVFQDLTCAAHGSDLWVAYASGGAMFMPGKDAPGDSVQITHSANGGGIFEAAVTVSDGAAGTQYLFPQLVRDPSGKLEIVYYQGTDGNPATLTRATSDTGATWKTSSLGAAGTFTLDRTLASWLGDYMGLASANGSTFVSYTENSEAKAHIAFTKVMAP
jgi:hypothetical protein